MGIRAAVGALCELERSLAISDPRHEYIRRVFPYPVPVKIAVPDRPCFMNAWSMTTFDGQWGVQSDQRYAVHTQLYVAEATAEADVSAEIATAFHEAFLTALIADPTLGRVVHDAEPRGGDPTLALLDRAGLSYIGLDLYVDLILYDPTEGP